LLTAYSIQSGKEYFPISWKLEYLNESNNWIVIDKRENVNEMKEEGKLVCFKLQKDILCSSLRLTVVKSTNEKCSYLSSFELFGSICDPNAILPQLIEIPKVITLATPMTFDFSTTEHNGLFNFFQTCSFKDRNNVFSINGAGTSKNSSVQNLLFWGEENWEAKYAYLSLSFKFPWIFKIFGYHLQSGNTNFLKNWKFCGFKSDHEKSRWNETVLDEQKNSSDLLRKNGEKSFPIQCDEFFDAFKFFLNENSEGKREFSLNAIEIFGILKKVE
jgi:hypothetical protein